MQAFHALPTLDVELAHNPQANGLPPILPRFVVPQLTDKPQDPILDALKRETGSRDPIRVPPRHPKRLSKLNFRDESFLAIRQSEVDDTLWTDAARRDGVGVRTKHLLSQEQPITYHWYRDRSCHGIHYAGVVAPKSMGPHFCQNNKTSHSQPCDISENPIVRCISLANSNQRASSFTPTRRACTRYHLCAVVRFPYDDCSRNKILIVCVGPDVREIYSSPRK